MRRLTNVFTAAMMRRAVQSQTAAEAAPLERRQPAACIVGGSQLPGSGSECDGFGGSATTPPSNAGCLPFASATTNSRRA